MHNGPTVVHLWYVSCTSLVHGAGPQPRRYGSQGSARSRGTSVLVVRLDESGAFSIIRSHDHELLALLRSDMTAAPDAKTISDKLCEFARTNFLAEGVEFNEHSPLADAGIDSFALVELLLCGERAFGIRVPESHLTRSNLVSVATLAHCIAELARNGHSPSP
jgi:acyl carrier protein